MFTLLDSETDTDTETDEKGKSNQWHQQESLDAVWTPSYNFMQVNLIGLGICLSLGLILGGVNTPLCNSKFDLVWKNALNWKGVTIYLAQTHASFEFFFS